MEAELCTFRSRPRGGRRRPIADVGGCATLVILGLSYFMQLCAEITAVTDNVALLDSASLPVEHRAATAYGAPSGDEAWALAQQPDLPQIKHLQVQCEKTHMRVNIEFDRPFYGIIFSKGHYSDHNCVHLKPGSGHLSATFEIYPNTCGMSSSVGGGGSGGTAISQPSGSYVENTIIVQYDGYVQEVWDQARKLRCTWYDFYEKAVTFRPFQVDTLHAVTANFLGDNLQCWMQIQVGKGPWASEVSGIVKIGQTMTMVLAIKDDENKFDMLVRNCVAHDGKRAPIQLVDQHGCVVRRKIMSKFQKIKNFGASASVVSFAYFQAFKFPDSMNVHFQCVIQVCRYNCPEPKCAGGEYGPPLLEGPPSPPGIPEYSLASPAPSLTLPEYQLNQLNIGPHAPPPEYHIDDFALPPPQHASFPPGLAYPDPRHPSEPEGAYSEHKPEISVPPPTSAETNLTSASSSSLNDIDRDDDLNLPPPPLPGQSASYATVKRKGSNSDENHNDNLMTLGGRPRSVDAKLRRSTNRIYKRETQDMTDVNTSRTIQVVSSGDVNFALSGGAAGNETVVSAYDGKDTVCVSVASFVAGLAMLLSALVVASLVAAFMFVRVRSLNGKAVSPMTAFVAASHPFGEDFIKMPN